SSASASAGPPAAPHTWRTRARLWSSHASRLPHSSGAMRTSTARTSAARSMSVAPRIENTTVLARRGVSAGRHPPPAREIMGRTSPAAVRPGAQLQHGFPSACHVRDVPQGPGEYTMKPTITSLSIAGALLATLVLPAAAPAQYRLPVLV